MSVELPRGFVSMLKTISPTKFKPILAVELTAMEVEEWSGTVDNGRRSSGDLLWSYPIPKWKNSNVTKSPSNLEPNTMNLSSRVPQESPNGEINQYDGETQNWKCQLMQSDKEPSGVGASVTGKTDLQCQNIPHHASNDKDKKAPSNDPPIKSNQEIRVDKNSKLAGSTVPATAAMPNKSQITPTT
ncbi:hypothetical protein HAX54_035518 [Datura stramonium]|uniref:Uncharacterized protein n=1 Tax=Datura stramonium TaxID=4076 RepID=A0ABS8SFD5_DATST|nr:hypothetical protein [Datura stramonium]